jgi:hypothetical protein
MEQGDTYYQKELEWLTLEYLEANTCLLVRYYTLKVMKF